MSSSPRLLFLTDSKSDDIHGPMQGGRDKDDGNESEERITGEEPRDRPSGNREAQKERPSDEIVLVEDGGFRTTGLVHRSLEERTREVPEERAEGQARGGPERHADRSERPRGIRREEVERRGQEQPQERPRQRAADKTPPRLPVAEEPLAIPEDSAEIDGRPPAEDDRHRVRDEGGEEEPQGLRDRLEGHRGRRRFVARI